MVKLNVGGALAGGATGALYGSSFGAPGAIIGGLAGAAGGLFGGNNKKRKPKKLSRFNAAQEGLFGDYAEGLQGRGQFANMYNFDEEGAGNVFDRTVGDPQYRNFQENIVPQITGQFRGGNLQNSSYAGQAVGRAGRNVQENLNALRQKQMFEGQEAANNRRMSGLDKILSMQTFDYEDQQAQQPGAFDQLMGGLAQNAGGYLRDYLGDRRKQQMGLKPGGQSYGSAGVDASFF